MKIENTGAILAFKRIAAHAEPECAKMPGHIKGRDTGSDGNELAGLIKEFGEENRIKLTGTLPREKVAELMQESDAFVLPSFKETFGVSYSEAMACGLPVIGTRNGGFDEIFNEDNRFESKNAMIYSRFKGEQWR